MKLALSLPWQGGSISVNSPATPSFFTDQSSGEVTIGAAISRLLEVGLYVGGALMFFWAIWGVFDYIKAEGNKEALAKARKKIQWAIAGFVILIISFFISDLLQSVLLLGGNAGTKDLIPLTQ